MKKRDDTNALLVFGAAVLLSAVSSAAKTVTIEERFEEKTEAGVTHTIVKILSIPAVMGAAAWAWFANQRSLEPFGKPQIWTEQWGNNVL